MPIWPPHRARNTGIGSSDGEGDRLRLGQLVIGKGDHLGDLEAIVGGVAKTQGFEQENLPTKPHNFVLWSPNYNLLLKKQAQDYRFFLCHHNAEFGENLCLDSEKYVFYLNHEGITHLRLSIIFTCYSNRDGDMDGVSNVQVNGDLSSDEALPLALYGKLESYAPKRK